MGDLAPFVLPATGGGGILAAFVYLLRYVTQLHRQLGEAQASAAVAATARAEKAELQLAALQLEVAALKTERWEEQARWARRAAAATQVRGAFPAEYRNWQFFEARIDDVLPGGERSSG